jgi:hypothetical protein
MNALNEDSPIVVLCRSDSDWSVDVLKPHFPRYPAQWFLVEVDQIMLVEDMCFAIVGNFDRQVQLKFHDMARQARELACFGVGQPH